MSAVLLSTSVMMLATLFELTYSNPVVGSNEAPDQFAPPWKPGTTTVPCRLGGLKAGPRRIFLSRARTSARLASPMSVTFVSSRDWVEIGGGFTGMGWVGDARSPGTSEA